MRTEDDPENHGHLPWQSIQVSETNRCLYGGWIFKIPLQSGRSSNTVTTTHLSCRFSLR